MGVKETIKKGLDKFLGKKDKEGKVVKLKTKDNELIERVDKKFITEDGRELLREVSHKIN